MCLGSTILRGDLSKGFGGRVVVPFHGWGYFRPFQPRELLAWRPVTFLVKQANGSGYSKMCLCISLVSPILHGRKSLAHGPRAVQSPGALWGPAGAQSLGGSLWLALPPWCSPGCPCPGACTEKRTEWMSLIIRCKNKSMLNCLYVGWLLMETRLREPYDTANKSIDLDDILI